MVGRFLCHQSLIGGGRLRFCIRRKRARLHNLVSSGLIHIAKTVRRKNICITKTTRWDGVCITKAARGDGHFCVVAVEIARRHYLAVIREEACLTGLARRIAKSSIEFVPI